MLSYGSAAIPLTGTELHSFSYAYDSVFSKLFKSYDKSTIKLCQFYCGFWPIAVILDYSRFVFLASLFNKGLISIRNCFDKSDVIELNELTVKYNFKISDSKYSLKNKVWSYLESALLVC